MVQSITHQIEPIGAVLIERSRRAKRINISIKPFRGVRVAVPKGVSLIHGEEFACSKVEWIERQLAKMKVIEKEINDAISETPRIDKKKASVLLTNRLDELASEHGFSCNKVTIRNQKTRWGSCSAKNNISLNIQLATLSPELIDYVILHELVHLKVKNHGPSFWNELKQLIPDAKERALRLKQVRIAFR